MYESEVYSDLHRDYHVEDSAWKADQILGLVDKGELSPESICEVGCGAGEILRDLGERLPGVRILEGFEPNRRGFELCQSKASQRLRFHQREIGENDGVYDLLLCIDVIEHVEDVYGFLRSILGHGNKFIFHIPLDMNVQMVMRNTPILGVREKVGHIHYFSKDTALSLLEECGYSIIQWCFTKSGLERPKSSKAKAANLIRRMADLVHREYAARTLGGYSLAVLAERTEDSAFWS